MVVTADLDIQAPQLQTILQTYLPFVLALPCVSLSSLLGEALRAANRTLGIVVAAYAVNFSILFAAVLAPSTLRSRSTPGRSCWEASSRRGSRWRWPGVPSRPLLADEHPAELA